MRRKRSEEDGAPGDRLSVLERAFLLAALVWSVRTRSEPRSTEKVPPIPVVDVGPAFRTMMGTVFIGFVLAFALQNAIQSTQVSLDDRGVTARNASLFGVVVLLSLYTFLIGQYNLALMPYGGAQWLSNFLIYVVQGIALAFMGAAIDPVHRRIVGFGVFLVIYYGVDVAWALFTFSVSQPARRSLPAWWITVASAAGLTVAAGAQAGPWRFYSDAGVGAVTAIAVAQVLVAALAFARILKALKASRPG